MATGLTPTEELIMDTLMVRRRIGEDVWTFSTRHGAALARLENRGLVGFKDAPVEGCYLVWVGDAPAAEPWRVPVGDRVDVEVAAEPGVHRRRFRRFVADSTIVGSVFAGTWAVLSAVNLGSDWFGLALGAVVSFGSSAVLAERDTP